MSAARTGVALAALVLAAAGTAPASPPPPYSAPERAFLHGAKPFFSANDVTSDLPAYVGARVAFVCTVDRLVQTDVLIGQCGKEIEPVELYVRMSTRHRRLGERFRVLGVMETPAQWTDLLGHTISYPVVRAVFVDRVSPGDAP